MIEKYQLDFNVPYGACDCHHHIYNPKQFKATPYPAMDWDNKPEHTVEDYRKLQFQSGFTRNVIVATSAYGYNTDSDLDAICKFGSNTTRMVGLLKKDVSDERLLELHQRGMRGSRGYFQTQETIEDFVALAPRLKKMGWHLDIMFSSHEETELFLKLLPELPCDIVISHQGWLHDVNDPYLPVFMKLLQEKRIWMKLSAIFRPIDILGDLQGTVVYAEEIARNIAVGEKLIEAAPDRLLWGSDWPFNWSNFSAYTDMETLMKVLPVQIKDEKVRHKILVENPAIVYGFDSVTV